MNPLLANLFRAGVMQGLRGMQGHLTSGNYKAILSGLDKEGALNVRIKDLTAIQRTLQEVEPKMARDYRSNMKKIGQPARRELLRGFRKIRKSPLTGRTEGNRHYDSMYTSYLSNISWYNASKTRANRAVDVDYKNRATGKSKKRLAKGDTTLGVVRLRVKSPAYILADISGRGNRRKPTGSSSRPYRINAFGKGVVMRTHTVNRGNTENFLRHLNSRAISGDRGKGPSRFAYPTVQRHMPQMRLDTQKVLRGTIDGLNKKLKGK